MAKRINWIDTARGIAIILVVLGHLSTEVPEIHNTVYSFHMPLFFILSGITMAKDMPLGNLCFIKKKIKSFIVPYFFWSAVYLIWCVITQWNYPKITILNVVNTITLSGISVLWFFSAVFISGILLHLFKHKADFMVLCIIIVSILLDCLNVYQMGEENILLKSGLLFTLLRPIYIVPFLYIGVKIQEKDILNKYSKKFSYNFACLLAFIAWLLSTFMTSTETDVRTITIHPVILYWISGFCGSVVILNISYWMEKIRVLSKPLEYLGKHSLFIMVTHEYFGIASVVCALTRSINNPLIGVLENTVLVMLCEVALIVFIEPYTHRLTNLLFKRLANTRAHSG